jgi:2-oxoglutarate ferredoxin oxidoreductase subunit gamma
MVDREPVRTDVKAVCVPCNQIAEQIGHPRLANMVAIGALLAVLPVLDAADIEAALGTHMPGRHRELLPKNLEALKKGADFARQAVVR